MAERLAVDARFGSGQVRVLEVVAGIDTTPAATTAGLPSSLSVRYYAAATFERRQQQV